MAETDDFTEFYTTHYRRLLGLLFVLTGTRRDAEDAVQEAFARALVRWETIRDREAPDAWVRVAAFKIASSPRRRAARMVTAMVRRGVSPAPTAAEDPSAAVVQAFCTLRLRYRRVLVLYYVAELPVSAIAEELSVSERAVRSYVRRGRDRLVSVLSARSAVSFRSWPGET